MPTEQDSNQSNSDISTNSDLSINSDYTESNTNDENEEDDLIIDFILDYYYRESMPYFTSTKADILYHRYHYLTERPNRFLYVTSYIVITFTLLA